MNKALPRNYLARTGRPWRPVKLLDLTVLLYHVWKGGSDDTVGFEDAGETIESLTRQLGGKLKLVNPSILESALWSCSLMNEQGKWADLKGRTFEQFLLEVLGPDKLHPIYHTISTKDDVKHDI